MAPKKTKTPKKGDAKATPAKETKADEVEKKEEETKDVEMKDAAAPEVEAPGSPKDAPGSPKKDAEKTEEAPEKEEPKEPEKPKKQFDVEWTETVPKDTRKKMGWVTEINQEDSSLTLVVSDNQLSTVNSHDGLHNLFSGGRATTGVKAGRYLFEVRVVDCQLQQGNVRVGFGTAAANVIAGADANSVCMDEAGGIISAGKQGPRSGRRQDALDVLGVVLNLDAASEQKNTVSFFRNGQRVGAPVPLPEALQGQTLFPMVSIRRAAVCVHFGAPDGRPLRELGFQARVLGDAAAADVVQTVIPPAGKREVVFPVGLPDEGTADFLDLAFYPNAKKKYVEVSERALHNLLIDSGYTGHVGNSQSFRIQELSAGKMLDGYVCLAASRKRDVVVMRSVRAALLRQERVNDFDRFNSSGFTRKAVVAVGTPPAAFTKKVKESVMEALRKAKSAQVNVEKNVWEVNRNNKQKRAEIVAKAANVKAKAEYAKKKKEWEAAKAKVEEGGEVPEEPAEPEEKAPEVEDEEEPDWAKKAEVSEEGVMSGSFRPRLKTGEKATPGSASPDIPADIFARVYENFSIPEEGKRQRVDARWLPEDEEMPAAAGEGFDAVEYVWAKKADAVKYLAEYKKARKVAEKFTGLVHGPYHKTQLEAWSSSKVELRKKHSLFVEREKKRKALKEKKAKAPAEEKKEEKKEEEKKEEEKKEEEKKEEETKEGEEKKEEEKKDQDEEMDLDYEAPEADVWGSFEDVSDTDARGTPLFKEFATEDWALVHWRFEIHHVVKAFAEDATAKDADRRGITPELFSYYYTNYFGKPLHPTSAGQKDMATFFAYFADVVETKDGVLVCKDKADVPINRLVRVTEEARRDRINRIAAGDESAKLSFAYTGPERSAVPKGKGKGVQARPYQPQYQAGGSAYQAAYSAANYGYGQPQKRPAYGGGYQPAKRPAYGAYGQPARPYGGKGGGKGGGYGYR